MNFLQNHADNALQFNSNAEPGTSPAAVRPGSLISSDLGQPCGGGTPRQARTERHDLSGRNLLEQFGINAADSPGTQALKDFDAVLETEYSALPEFPSAELTRELQRVVHKFVAPYGMIWNCWQDRQDLAQLTRVFNWGEVVVHAAPYVDGAGLALWGFSTNSRVRGRVRRLVFVNTAHQSGATVATIGHELGHYIFASIAGHRPCELPPMDSMFQHHLKCEEELFCDAVVAMLSYSHHAINQLMSSTPRDVTAQLRAMLTAVDPHYRIDFCSRSLATAWRIRYLTFMVHFFRLRCALFDTTGI